MSNYKAQVSKNVKLQSSNDKKEAGLAFSHLDFVWRLEFDILILPDGFYLC